MKEAVFFWYLSPMCGPSKAAASPLIYDFLGFISLFTFIFPSSVSFQGYLSLPVTYLESIGFYTIKPNSLAGRLLPTMM